MLIYKLWLELIDLGKLTRLNLVLTIISIILFFFGFQSFKSGFGLQVMIYRLITRGTIEERMMQLTKKKMVLEHLVVGRLKAQNINQVCKYLKGLGNKYLYEDLCLFG